MSNDNDKSNYDNNDTDDNNDNKVTRMESSCFASEQSMKTDEDIFHYS